MEKVSPQSQRIPSVVPLARDEDGNQLAVPDGAIGWRIRRQTGGRPRVVLDSKKQPMMFPLDCTIAHVEEIVAPGSYLLDMIDKSGDPLGVTVGVRDAAQRGYRRAGQREQRAIGGVDDVAELDEFRGTAQPLAPVEVTQLTVHTGAVEDESDDDDDDEHGYDDGESGLEATPHWVTQIVPITDQVVQRLSPCSRPGRRDRTQVRAAREPASAEAATTSARHGRVACSRSRWTMARRGWNMRPRRRRRVRRLRRRLRRPSTRRC
jgi:hypothetical protein